MAVFKDIGGGNHKVESFEVNASHSFAWTSGSTFLSGSGFSINLANEPPIYYPIGTQDLGGTTDGGFSSYPMFNSVKKYFYIGESSASTDNIYGFYPSGSMFVWNVGSNYTGEGIKRNSFKVELDGNSLNVQDDGTGKLRLNATGSVVGNVFYEHGVAAIQRNMTASAASLISDDGISILDTAGVTSSFQSVVHIYEHIVDCQIKPSEFNLTFNPSVFETAASGIGSFNDYMNSGSAQPYITTIGLYNDAKELLVVAKLSKPITRMKYTDQTFIVKFDE